MKSHGTYGLGGYCLVLAHIVTIEPLEHEATTLTVYMVNGFAVSHTFEDHPQALKARYLLIQAVQEFYLC